jgi:aryl-alcohol dehydrogenase-like predicted oxidoreductase
MRTRKLGGTDLNVSVIGYGAAALSAEDGPEEAEAQAILDRVVSLGVTLIDTADTYCPSPGELHHNERLVARCLAGRRERVLVATKGGTVRTGAGWGIDGNPARLYRSICESHQALGGDAPITLWQHHWPDPRYTIAQMLEPVRRAQEEGLISHVGVGNYSLEQLRQACDCLPIVSIQNQYNLWHRGPEHDGLFEFCSERGVTFLAWRPLGGAGLAERLGEIELIARCAKERGISPQRFVTAWMLAHAPCVVPLCGARRPEHVADTLAAVDVRLDPREMSLLNGLNPSALPRRQRPPAWVDHPPLA